MKSGQSPNWGESSRQAKLSALRRSSRKASMMSFETKDMVLGGILRAVVRDCARAVIAVEYSVDGDVFLAKMLPQKVSQQLAAIGLTKLSDLWDIDRPEELRKALRNHPLREVVMMLHPSRQRNWRPFSSRAKTRK